MGARYYDASKGQFTQTDPLGDGYRYTDGNPVNYLDPTGMQATITELGGGWAWDMVCPEADSAMKEALWSW